jgi:hypothetical protein
VNANREAKIDQTWPQPASDRRIEIAGLLNVGRGLPEGGWRRMLALWGYSGTPPFFTAFRNRPVR